MIRFDFSGKRVLVTGGTQGIGLGVATAFADAGASVFITGTRADARAYDDDLSRFTYLRAEMSERGDRQALAAQVGDLDVLVNNAGQGRADEYTMDGFEHVMSVNLTACVELSYLFHDTLAARGGAIVNIGSGSSFLAIRQQPAYTTSKTALLGFTRAVADQWAHDGIRVNLVAPGFIETRMTQGTRDDDRRRSNALRAIPAKRFGTPEEIAACVLFLASPAASYVTGQSLVADGGLLLR